MVSRSFSDEMELFHSIVPHPFNIFWDSFTIPFTCLCFQEWMERRLNSNVNKEQVGDIMYECGPAYSNEGVIGLVVKEEAHLTKMPSMRNRLCESQL